MESFDSPTCPSPDPSEASETGQVQLIWQGVAYSPSSCESVWMHLDGTRVTERVIGLGGSGLIIVRGDYAVKVPRISRYIKIGGVPVEPRPLTPKEGDYDERVPLLASLGVEKAIYKRLGEHSGIVRCHNLDSTDVSIQMDLMKGDLRQYLAEKRPEQKVQLSWLSKMAHTMAYIHDHRVIIADIRLDNLLLDDTLAVKFCDFSESALMPLDWDIGGTDDLGFSIFTDIGQFGGAMYEIITGLRLDYDLPQDDNKPESLFICPPRDSLPSTQNIWLGHIIDKCWTQAFNSAHELAAELDFESIQ